MKLPKSLVLLAFSSVALVACADDTRTGTSNDEATAAKPQEVTVRTLVSCEQDDGDQWFEVGISERPSSDTREGLVAYVIKNDADDGSSKLVGEFAVFQGDHGLDVSFTDKADTFKLYIKDEPDHPQGRLAELSVLDDGPNGIALSGLYCYDDSHLTFTR